MPANAARRLSRRSRIYPLLIGAAAAFWLGVTAPVGAQTAADPAGREFLDVSEEPGRVSTDEVVITDGPYHRQLVLFRTNEAPGTFVV